MFAEERQERIYELLCEKNSVKVAELSQIFQASEVTIRRDLDALQKQNRLLRIHGGAVRVHSVGRALIAGDLQTTQVQEKRQIAKLAYRQIKDFDTLLLDSSSTVLALCRLLKQNPKRSLRIVTTSLEAVLLLAACQSYQLLLVGGEYNVTHQTVEGYLAGSFIESIRVDKCFVGINGVDESFRLSTPRFEDAAIKEHMIRSSERSYVLADHSKFGEVYLAPVIQTDVLITDKQLPDFSYEKADLELLFADDKGV